MSDPSNRRRDMADVVDRVTGYLCGGGFFNPELANHEAVRDLLIDCRTEIERLRSALVDARESVEAWSGYAFDYFKDKHDLEGDLARIDAALGKKP